MREKILQLMEVTGVITTMRETMVALNKQVRPMMEMMALIGGKSTSWESYETTLLNELPKLYEAVIPAYEIYTEAEIDAMTVFFSSEAGKSVVAKQPQVIKASAAIAAAHVEKFLEREARNLGLDLDAPLPDIGPATAPRGTLLN